MKERNLAAIDLGTNSFHIIIVKVKEDGTFESLGKEKESVRLGSGSGNYEVITPDAIERGIKCLKRFKGLADIHNSEVRAVATSALREAKNRDVFLWVLLAIFFIAPLIVTSPYTLLTQRELHCQFVYIANLNFL